MSVEQPTSNPQASWERAGEMTRLREEVERLTRELARLRMDHSRLLNTSATGGSDTCITCAAHVLVITEDLEPEIKRLRAALEELIEAQYWDSPVARAGAIAQARKALGPADELHQTHCHALREPPGGCTCKPRAAVEPKASPEHEGMSMDETRFRAALYFANMAKDNPSPHRHAVRTAISNVWDHYERLKAEERAADKTSPESK